jgi:hypothetical protein
MDRIVVSWAVDWLVHFTIATLGGVHEIDFGS